MEIILGLLGVGAGAVVLFGIQAGVDRTVSAVDKTVRSGRLASGRTELNKEIEFSAPVTSERVIDAVVRVVNAHQDPPPLVQGLFVNARTPQGVEFAVGNRFEVNMTASVLAWPADEGSEGVCAIGSWSEQGAQVLGVEEFARIRERVITAVTELGGEVREVIPAAP